MYTVQYRILCALLYIILCDVIISKWIEKVASPLKNTKLPTFLHCTDHCTVPTGSPKKIFSNTYSGLKVVFFRTTCSTINCSLSLAYWY